MFPKQRTGTVCGATQGTFPALLKVFPRNSESRKIWARQGSVPHVIYTCSTGVMNAARLSIWAIDFYVGVDTQKYVNLENGLLLFSF